MVFNLKGGMVIANPIPTEFEMDYDTINSAIESALKEADEKGVKILAYDSIVNIDNIKLNKPVKVVL